MNLVDVHCHLNHTLFKDDVYSVIKRAKKAGVKAVIVSGVNSRANREVLELVKKDPILKASLGMYPIDALGLSKGETGLPRQVEPINLDKEFEFIKKNKDKIVAIGEVGMDFHWDKDRHKEQEDNFRKIIKFAKDIKKPIIVHSRKAEKECLDILEEELPNNEIPVIMHCFSGNKKLIKRGAELGYYFSIPPNIVKLQHFQTLVELVNMQQLLTETDAPWLSPFPDKKNEPAFVIEAIQKISKIKEISKNEVVEQIWKNYKNIFRQ